MNVFCRIFGHTWQPTTRVPASRWYTTKKGDILVQDALGDASVQHVDVCARCATERAAPAMRHDTEVDDSEEAAPE